MPISGKDNCDDIALPETLFQILHAELIWPRAWETRRQSEAVIIEYIANV
ncbi:hypothetical protein GCM10022290_44470 [Sagittula marina]